MADDGLHPCPICGGVDMHDTRCDWKWQEYRASVDWPEDDD